ncbi:organic solute transporter-related protein [Babesia gibsoni]|uniref:Organic solute transporter-related protein n=1 Tax=Babesia gibsoni TaxID=33632 RepID=A0AAD8LRH4_BABGI|nr:organic solute transporter-related protein [Babesia gibsoni]
MELAQFLESYGCNALVFTTLITSQVISIYVLLQHLLHYETHHLQSYVVRILVFMPIYGAITYLLYLLPGLFDILEMLRNIWEGLLIHSFLCLMMEYCGGENNCGQMISIDPSVMKHPWPVCTITMFSLNEDIPLNAGFIKNCRMGTMQYAFVRPILAILSVAFRLMGIGDLLVVSLFKSFVVNVSVYLALYALGLFYLATKKHPGLEKANCLIKCIALKMMVVFTFYQDCFIYWFTTLDSYSAELMATVLILLELPIFAILQLKAYSVEEFIGARSARTNTTNVSEGDMEDPTSPEMVSIFNKQTLDFCSMIGFNAEDIYMFGTKHGRDKIVKNASVALNMTDLINDIYYSCSDKYKKHSLITQDTAGSIELDLSAQSKEVEQKAGASENFAEFDRVQNLQSLEEKANNLSKLQFL